MDNLEDYLTLYGADDIEKIRAKKWPLVTAYEFRHLYAEKISLLHKLEKLDAELNKQEEDGGARYEDIAPLLEPSDDDSVLAEYLKQQLIKEIGLNTGLEEIIYEDSLKPKKLISWFFEQIREIPKNMERSKNAKEHDNL